MLVGPVVSEMLDLARVAQQELLACQALILGSVLRVHHVRRAVMAQLYACLWLDFRV